MCIAIHKKSGVQISKEIYERCFKEHPDGAGFSYVDGGKLVTQKGFLALFDEFYDALLPHAEKELIVHFRTASPGMVVDLQNCHPFAFDIINGDDEYQFSLIHNGKLDWRSDKDHSDTSCFVHDLVKPMLTRDPWFLDHWFGIEMMQRTILQGYGTASKIAIMRYCKSNNETKVYIINEKAGNRSTEGIWFSNYTWLTKTVSAYTPPLHGYENWPIKAKNVTPTGPLFTSDRDREDYSKPDVNGWKWDVTEDNWLNVRTNVRSEELNTRERPYSVTKYSPKNRDRYLKWLKDNRESMEEGKVLKLKSVKQKKDSTTAHLTGPELKMIMAECTEALKRQGFDKEEMKMYDKEERLHLLREHTMDVYIGQVFSTDSTAEVDTFILNKIKEGVYRNDLIAFEINMAKGSRVEDITEGVVATKIPDVENYIGG